MNTTIDLFENTLNVSTHEIVTIVRHLTNTTTSDDRLRLLRALRQVVKRTQNVLPTLTIGELYECIEAIVREEEDGRGGGGGGGGGKTAPLCECLWLLVDTMPSLGANLDHYMAPILPRIVANLGAENVDVRRASLRLLHVYMRHTSNLQKALKTLIEFGVENAEDVVAQRGTVLSLPLLFTDEFGRENLFALVNALCRVLVRADTQLFYPVFLALQRLHSIVGNETFHTYLQRVDSSEARALYSSVLSRNSTQESIKEEEKLFLDKSIPLQSIITMETSNEMMMMAVQGEEEGSVASEEDNNNNSNLANFAKSEYLVFGVFPRALLLQWSSHRFEERLQSMETMVRIVREIDGKRLSRDLSPHLREFFVDFISGEVLDSRENNNNFKVTLLALDLIEIIVCERMSEEIKILSKHNSLLLQTIVLILLKRLGDARTVVRDSVVRVLHQMMHTYPPQHILEVLLTQKPSKNPRVREEVVNRVTAAVLTFPRSEFNLPKLCFFVAPSLADNRRSVRVAALECTAVLAQALGPHHLAPLMAAVEAVETSCECEGPVAAVHARLARRALPRCAADGCVRYVLSAQQFTGWFSEGTDADLEWLMLATNSNSGTPPKGGIGNSVAPRKTSNGTTVSGIPGSIPFDRRKVLTLPDETTETSRERRKSIALNTVDKVLASGLIGREAEEEERGVGGGDAHETTTDDKHFWREVDDNRETESDVWRQYFTRFRRQLAEEALCASTHEQTCVFTSLEQTFNNKSNDELILRKKSQFCLPLEYTSAQDLTRDEFNRIQSPQQSSSSAPSTASADVQYFPPEQHLTTLANNALFDKTLERSLSLPSIGQQMQTTIDSNNNNETTELTTSDDQNVISLHSNEFIPKDIEHVKLTSPPLLSSSLTTKPDENRCEAMETPLNEEKETEPLVESEALVRESEVNEPNGEEEKREMPELSVEEATPLHSRRTPVADTEKRRTCAEEERRLDVWTQKDETLSSETSEEITETENKREEEEHKKVVAKGAKVVHSRTPQTQRRVRVQTIGRQSRSQSPQSRRRPSRAPQQIYIKTTPAIAANANIRHILANVAKTEGPFDNANEALRAALMALHDDAWTTKVEGMLAVTRLATFHAHTLLKEQHTVVCAIVQEVKNLRSTVARSAIFTAGELFAKLRQQIEPEMDALVGALLAKAAENVVFMREDIERALMNAVEEMPQTRTALSLIANGANHRNSFVRKTCAQFLSLLVERMGSIKCLLGPRDIGEHLLPSAARFVQDGSPHTRYYGRKIFAVLVTHSAFDKLLRKHVTPGTYRNICGILESIKRRGIGDRPNDLCSPLKSTPSVVT